MKMSEESHKNQSIASVLSDCRCEIMGIAAFLLVVYHVFFPVLDEVPFLREVEDFFLMRGFWAADVFFFVSGMGLVRSVSKYSIGEFYYRRLRRILIPYLVIGILSAVKMGWSILYFLKTVSGISFITGEVHALLWYVPAIVICYILFPFYYRLLKKVKRPVLLTVILSLVIIITETAGVFIGYSVHAIFILRIPAFLLGTMFGELKDDKRFLITRKTIIICILVMSLGIFLLSGVIPALDYVPYPTSSIIAIPFSILAAYVLDMTSSGFIIRRALQFIGKVSLELYCVHVFLFNEFAVDIINKYLPRYFSFNPALLVNLILFICFMLFAYLLYFVNKGVIKLTDKALKM